MKSDGREIPVISTRLSRQDVWGAFKARWGAGRMNYRVDPGLYAVGHPDQDSPVLVTANYKLSFDALRRELDQIDCWILALDTDGVNVWCAAGKGSFGTDELVRRIEGSGLPGVVSHRRLIVPQLGGPGVSSFEVKRRSGFKVVFGPIEARDIPAFMTGGLKATPEMRLKTFDLRERFVLIPVELVQALKPAALVALGFVVVSGLTGPNSFWSNALQQGLFAACALMAAVVAGAIVTPLLLPWLPGRAFSLKGLIPGLLAAAIALTFKPYTLPGWANGLESLAWVLLSSALATYLALNFTGASTYTSLSGVKKEMKWAIPLQIAAALVGIVCWIGSRFVA